jgi:hypothetical protein
VYHGHGRCRRRRTALNHTRNVAEGALAPFLATARGLNPPQTEDPRPLAIVDGSFAEQSCIGRAADRETLSVPMHWRVHRCLNPLSSTRKSAQIDLISQRPNWREISVTYAPRNGLITLRAACGRQFLARHPLSL